MSPWYLYPAHGGGEVGLGLHPKKAGPSAAHSGFTEPQVQPSLPGVRV
jgi:hypothetical protein